MQLRVFTPTEDVLAGRVLQTIRSVAPDATVELVSDPAAVTDDDPDGVVVIVTSEVPAAAFDADTVVALATREADVPEEVLRVPIEPDAPAAGLDALRAWVTALCDGRDPSESLDLGRVAGAAALGGVAGFLLGGLLGEDDEPPFGGDLF